MLLCGGQRRVCYTGTCMHACQHYSLRCSFPPPSLAPSASRQARSHGCLSVSIFCRLAAGVMKGAAVHACTPPSPSPSSFLRGHDRGRQLAHGSGLVVTLVQNNDISHTTPAAAAAARTGAGAGAGITTGQGFSQVTLVLVLFPRSRSTRSRSDRVLNLRVTGGPTAALFFGRRRGQGRVGVRLVHFLTNLVA